MTLDRDLRNLNPGAQTDGVLYTLHLPLDDGYAAIAARYHRTVEALDAASRAHGLLAIARRSTGDAARAEPLYLELDDLSRAFDWATVFLRDSSETLGSLCARLRRHPLRPVAEPATLWNTPLNATLRAEVTVAMHPLATSRDPAVVELDRHPERAVLPRGSAVWVPFPMSFTQAEISAAPTEATAGGAAAVGSAAAVEPGWLRALLRDIEELRSKTRETQGHVEACERRRRAGAAFHAQVAKVRLLLGAVDGVGRASADGWNVRGLIDAVDDLARESHERLIVNARQSLFDYEAGNRDQAALQLWHKVADQGLRDRARQLALARVPRPEVLDDLCSALREAHAALLLSPQTEDLAGRALRDAVDSVGTSASPAELRGATALEDVVSLVPAEDPGAPASMAAAALRSFAGTIANGFEGVVMGFSDTRHRRLVNPTAFVTALGQVGTYAGNLPGPPSLCGAVMNLHLQHVVSRFASGVPSEDRELRRVVEALRRTVALSEEDAVKLETLAYLRRAPSRQTVEEFEHLIGKVSARYQGGPRWTTGLGVLSLLAVTATAYATYGTEHERQRRAGDSDELHHLRIGLAVAPVVQGTATVLSAVFQRVAIRRGLDVGASSIHTTIAGHLGSFAAWFGVAVYLGGAGVALHDGNYADSISGGVSAAAGVLMILGGPYTIAFGLALGIAGPLVVSAWSEELNQLSRTRAQRLIYQALKGLREGPLLTAEEERARVASGGRGQGPTLLDRVELYTGERVLREKVDAALAVWRSQTFPRVDPWSVCEVPPEQRPALGGRTRMPFDDALRAVQFTAEEIALCHDPHEYTHADVNTQGGF